MTTPRRTTKLRKKTLVTGAVAVCAAGAVAAGVFASLGAADDGPGSSVPEVSVPSWFPEAAASSLVGIEPASVTDLGSTRAGERVVLADSMGGDRCLIVIDADLAAPGAGTSRACYAPAQALQHGLVIWRQNDDRSLTFWATGNSGDLTAVEIDGERTVVDNQRFASETLRAPGATAGIVVDQRVIPLDVPPVK